MWWIGEFIFNPWVVFTTVVIGTYVLLKIVNIFGDEGTCLYIPVLIYVGFSYLVAIIYVFTFIGNFLRCGIGNIYC